MRTVTIRFLIACVVLFIAAGNLFVFGADCMDAGNTLQAIAAIIASVLCMISGFVSGIYFLNYSSEDEFKNVIKR